MLIENKNTRLFILSEKNIFDLFSNNI